MLLTPGSYLFEIAFGRPVDPTVLERVLRGMGFSELVFDDEGAETGALSSTLSRSTQVVASRPSSPALQAAPRSTTAVPSPRPTTVSVPSSPRATSSPALRTQASSVLQGPRATASPTPSRSVASQVYQGPRSTAFPVKPRGKQTLPGGLGSPEPGTSSEPGSSASEALTDAGIEQQPGGGGGGEGGFSPSASPESEETQAEAPTETSPGPTEPTEAVPESIPELWRRWVEWGSPFAQGPSRVSGEDETVRYRIVGLLDRPVEIQDTSDIRWLFVQRLSLNPFSDLTLQARPFVLRRGTPYTFRLLAPSRFVPNREALRAGLVAMGWAPMKLVPVKKNIRLPGKAASLTAWVGVGVWVKAESVVVYDEPFFFEDVREVRT